MIQYATGSPNWVVVNRYVPMMRDPKGHTKPAPLCLHEHDGQIVRYRQTLLVLQLACNKSMLLSLAHT